MNASARQYSRSASGLFYAAGLLATGLLLALPARVDAQRRLDLPGCTASSLGGVPASRISRLARGFNLPGWLDGDSPRLPDLNTLARLRARGFTHIRLPLVETGFAGDRVLPQVRADRLENLDRALDALLSRDYSVTIDMHPSGDFGRMHARDPERGAALLEQSWLILSRHLARRDPERVFLELLNEPTTNREMWIKQAEHLTKIIRTEAPGHTIIYGPADFQRVEALVATVPLSDPNIVYAFHYYDPMVFTHQGLDWEPENPLADLRRVPFPASSTDPRVRAQILGLQRRGKMAAARELETQLAMPWTTARIEEAIATAGAWSSQRQRAVILNEFGALAAHSQPEDRARWLETVRTAAERNCVGWTHWDYADGFGFVRRERGREIPDEGILRALLGR
jgi:endoglucanase